MYTQVPVLIQRVKDGPIKGHAVLAGDSSRRALAAAVRGKDFDKLYFIFRGSRVRHRLSNVLAPGGPLRADRYRRVHLQVRVRGRGGSCSSIGRAACMRAWPGPPLVTGLGRRKLFVSLQSCRCTCRRWTGGVQQSLVACLMSGHCLHMCMRGHCMHMCMRGHCGFYALLACPHPHSNHSSSVCDGRCGRGGGGGTLHAVQDCARALAVDTARQRTRRATITEGKPASCRVHASA